MKRDLILITDPGSVDPDDILTLPLLISLLHIYNIIGVITTHHYPEKRALLTKLILSEFGYQDIPVYIGEGIPFKKKLDVMDREKWLYENKLFPKIFGYPSGVYNDNITSDEKYWFPNFMKAYEESYDIDYLKLLNNKIEKERGWEQLVKLLSSGKYSPDNKLLVVEIGPVHDLVKVPTYLYKNMEIFIMGGGFEENIDDIINNKTDILKIPKIGYNWGISPRFTKEFLEKLSNSGTYATLVSSNLVRRKNMQISVEYFNKWLNLAENNSCPKITRAMMKDWIYCNRGNKLSEHKNICDPTTLFLASEKYNNKAIRFKTTIENEDIFTKDYLQTDTSGKQLLNMKKDKNGNINLIIDFEENRALHEIIKRIEHIMLPIDRDIGKKINSVIEDGKKYKEGFWYKSSLNDATYLCFNKKYINNEYLLKNKGWIRDTILTNTNMLSNTKIIQFVGDCDLYKEEYIVAIKNFVDRVLEKYNDIIIEWGFTGKESFKSNQYDINCIVGEIIDRENIPSIGSLVNYHSVKAIEEWGCSHARNCKLFTLVYSDKGALFGDDCDLTDMLCDILVVVDGGIQSFNQIVNCLIDDKQIHVLYGARDTEKERDYDVDTKTFIKYFNAGEFLSIFSDINESKQSLNKKNINQILSYYLEERELYDKRKGDANTKDKLFDHAWNKFVDNELWKKMNLVSINNVNEFISTSKL